MMGMECGPDFEVVIYFLYFFLISNFFKILGVIFKESYWVHLKQLLVFKKYFYTVFLGNIKSSQKFSKHFFFFRS